MVLGEEAEFFLFDDKGRRKHLGNVRDQISRNHHRGGQSQNRLARLRTEQIHRYLTQVEDKIRLFYTKEGAPVIRQLILFGSGNKKDQLRERVRNSFRDLPVTVLSDLEIETVQEKFLQIIGQDKRTDSEIQIDIIKEWMRTDPDRLVFGKENVRQEIEEKKLEKVWMSPSGEGSREGLDVILVDHYYLEILGSCVGLRWSGVTYEDPDSFDSDSSAEDNSDVDESEALGL